MSSRFSSNMTPRGKSSKKLRQGPKTYKSGKRDYTPNSQAINKLNKALEKYPINDSVKNYFKQEALKLEQLRTMNMTLLAATFMFLEGLPTQATADGNNEIILTQANFEDHYINPFLDRLMPTSKDIETQKLTTNDLMVMKIQFKASILRYAQSILAVRT